MHGVSGVGKTYLAKALNSETFDAVTFFNISASMLISKWRGESEKFAKVWRSSIYLRFHMHFNWSRPAETHGLRHNL